MNSLEQIELVDNIERNRLEFHFDSSIAYADYIICGKTVIIHNSQIPHTLIRLDGFIESFVRKIVEKMKESNLDVQLQCPFLYVALIKSDLM